MSVHIVADSTADIDRETAEALGIAVVPLTVYFGEKSYLDGVEMNSAQFFQRLPGAQPLPRTAAPAPGDFLAAFERLAGPLDEVLCVTISSNLSGTYNAACAARAQFRDPARISILDSLGTTAASANVVLAAARAVKAGRDRVQAEAIAHGVAGRQEILIGLETLAYLQRGGRIGRAQAFLGGILSVKPLLTLRDGEVAPAERVRSRSRMIERLYQFAISHSDADAIRIVHAAAPDDCRQLVNRVRSALPEARVETGWIGPVVGVYSGPGALGVALVPRGDV
ncbi:MAG: DegV family protein [Dehalococcoidia bacterium]